MKNAQQGVPYPIRQLLKIARIQIDIDVTRVNPGEKSESEGSKGYKVSMTSTLSGLGFISAAPLRAVGIPTKKTENRILDGSEFTQVEPLVGEFIGRMWLCSLKELATEDLEGFLRDIWIQDASEDEYFIRFSIKSQRPGSDAWSSEQVWGIREGRYTGTVKMSRGTQDTAYAKLVYDYQS